MMVRSVAGLGIGVHESRGQARQGVQQGMLGADCDLMRLNGGGAGVDHDLAFGPQLMADPAQPDLADAEHAGGPAQVMLGLVDQGRFHRIHQAPVDLAACLAEHGQDHHGDQEADDRIGPVPAQGSASHAQQHRQGGEPVGAGVQPVGDQGG